MGQCFDTLNLEYNICWAYDTYLKKIAVVWFSVGGEYYIQEPVTYIYMADTILKEPRNVSIRLNGHVGRYVKLELYFSNVWLSISEVNFDSDLARGIYQPEETPSQQMTASISNNVTAEITNQQTEPSTEESAKTQGKQG